MSNQDTRRPRISKDAHSVVKRHADKRGKSIRSMLEEIIYAYDDDLTDTVHANNQLLRDLHNAIGIDGSGLESARLTDALEEATPDEETVTDGASTGLTDFNVLNVGHTVAINPEGENWRKLYDNHVIKNRPKYVIPVVQGFINHMFVEDRETVTKGLLTSLIKKFGLSDSSVRNYLYKYGPEYDAWYPSPDIDREFKSGKLYTATVEAIAKDRQNRHQAHAVSEYQEELQKTKSQYPSFAKLYGNETYRDENDETTDLWPEPKEMYLTREGAENHYHNLTNGVQMAIKQHGPSIARRYLLGYLLVYGDNRGYTDEDEAFGMRKHWKTENGIAIPDKHDLFYDD